MTSHQKRRKGGKRKRKELTVDALADLQDLEKKKEDRKTNKSIALREKKLEQRVKRANANPRSSHTSIKMHDGKSKQKIAERKMSKEKILRSGKSK